MSDTSTVRASGLRTSARASLNPYPISKVLYEIPEYSVLSIIIAMALTGALAIIIRKRLPWLLWREDSKEQERLMKN
jgi:hypothetical protein